MPLLAIGLLWYTDPDVDAASTKIWMVRMLVAFIAIALSHWVRKSYFNYPEANIRELFVEVKKGNTAAGLALIAISIFLYGVLQLFGAATH
jgi:hypothetical protein